MVTVTIRELYTRNATVERCLLEFKMESQLAVNKLLHQLFQCRHSTINRCVKCYKRGETSSPGDVIDKLRPSLLQSAKFLHETAVANCWSHSDSQKHCAVVLVVL